ncbi:MAG: DUF4013 domain-containing protein [Halolamina sp.]
MFREALSAPVESEDTAGTVIVGTLLTAVTLVLGAAWALATASSPLGLVLTPAVALPGAIRRGYTLRVVAAGVREGSATPSFVRWGGLVRTGLRSYVLTAAYLLPGVAVVVAVLVLGGLTANELPETAAGFAAAGTLLVALGVGVGYALVAAVALPAAQATLAVEGRLRDGLAAHRVLSRAASGAYLLALAGTVAVVAGGAVLGWPLSVVAVGFAVLFYARVVAAGLVGRGLSTALGEESAGEPGSDSGRRLDAVASEPSVAVQVGRGVASAESDGGIADAGGTNDGDGVDGIDDIDEGHSAAGLDDRTER